MKFSDKLLEEQDLKIYLLKLLAITEEAGEAEVVIPLQTCLAA